MQGRLNEPRDADVCKSGGLKIKERAGEKHATCLEAAAEGGAEIVLLCVFAAQDRGEGAEGIQWHL
jgi:hypothetical protein